MRVIFLFLFVLLTQWSLAQSPANIEGASRADSLFWNAYNHCDVATMKACYADDIEFYHDKGGIAIGSQALAKSFQKGPCKNPDSFSLRRDAVPGTIKVYPLYASGTLYGAIVSGDHVFYIRQKDKKPYADGQAKFANLWLIENGTWKMKRVLSYDHQPFSHSNEKTVTTVPVSAAILKEYAGKYQGGENGSLTVQSAKGYLVIISGNARFNAYPSSSTLFVVKEKDLSFQFAKKAAGIMDVIVRENGEIVDTYHAVKR